MPSREPSPPASRVSIAIALGLVYVLWGSTYLGIRYAIESLPPFSMAGVRFLFAGTLLFAWARFHGAPRPTLREWRATSLVGLLLLLGGNGAVVWAQRHGVPSALAALLVTTTPLWMVLLDWWLRGRRPTRSIATGLALGALGIVILIGPSGLSTGTDGLTLGALLAVIGAALSWALGSIHSQRASMPSSPLLAAGMEMLAGGTALLALGVAHRELEGFDPAAVTATSWAAFAYLVVFGSLVGFTAYSWLLRNAPISLASTYAYVNPVVAVLLGWAFAGEALGLRVWVAAPLVIGAVALITRFQSTSATDASAPAHDAEEPSFGNT